MQPVPEDWQRAVAVVAHPDDLEYGPASAIARWTSQGREVSYLIATRGEAGIAGLPPRETGPLRESEQRRSAAIVGVRDLEFLDYPDGSVEYSVPLRRDLAAALRRSRPDFVLTMNFELTWGEDGPVNQADHRAVGLAALDACRDAANEWVFPEAGPAWSGIRYLFAGASGEPTHFVDVTNTLDAGIASLREHSTYIKALGGDFDPDEFLRNLTGYVGLAVGCEYAVALRRYRLTRELSVTDFRAVTSQAADASFIPSAPLCDCTALPRDFSADCTADSSSRSSRGRMKGVRR